MSPAPYAPTLWSAKRYGEWLAGQHEKVASEVMGLVAFAGQSSAKEIAEAGASIVRLCVMLGPEEGHALLELLEARR